LEILIILKTSAQLSETFATKSRLAIEDKKEAILFSYFPCFEIQFR
jgi:hypothetical protein